MNAKCTNRGGIPCMSGVGTLSGTTLTVSFPNTTVPASRFSGLVNIRVTGSFSVSSTTATAINFVLGSQAPKAVQAFGTVATGADIPNPGFYLAFIDAESGTITLIN